MDASSDVASDALSIIHMFKEKDTTIDTLTKEIVFYTKEQQNLRNEITALIKENKALSETVKQLLEWQTNHKCELYDDKLADVELVQNLKAQLCCIQKEKDTAVELWQTTLRSLNQLENNLTQYEGMMDGFLSKAQVSNMKIAHDSEIAQLNEQNRKLEMDLDICNKSVHSKNIELSKATDKQTSTYAVVKHLEADIQNFTKKLQDITKMKDDLQSVLEMKNRAIAELQAEDIQAKRKVSEALQVVEAACFEKDAALARANEAKLEVVQISRTVSEIIDENTEKVKFETENIKQCYSNKLKKVQDNMQNLQKELKDKDSELTKCLRESFLLNQELDKLRKGSVCVEESHTSKLLILEKNLESTFQKLLLSEKKSLQLDAEKESIKCDLEQMANCYKNDIRTREMENDVMKKQLTTLKIQLKTSNTNVHQAINKAGKYKAQMKHLDAVIKEKLKEQQIIHKQALSKSIEGIQTNNTQIQSELQRYVQLQRSLNKQIKKEMVEIINELEKRMEELKQAKNSLEQDLKNVIKDNLYYKENIKQFCTKVMNLAGN